MATRRGHPSGAVLFDVDGTLVDSNYLHVVAWTAAFRAVGHPVDGAAIHRAIGMGAGQLIGTLLGDELAEELGARAKAEHRDQYRGYFELLRPFDGARDLLRAVAARARVVLVTSAGSEELKVLRATLDVEDAIAEITSGSDVEAAKPEPDVVQVALERCAVAPSDAVFVGDTVFDVEAAGKAGVACIGVLTGGISAAELRSAGAVAVYDSVADILSGLEESPLRDVFPTS